MEGPAAAGNPNAQSAVSSSSSTAPEGSVYDPTTGQRFSARLNPKRATEIIENAAKDGTLMKAVDTAGLGVAAAALDITDDEVDEVIEGSEIDLSTIGGKRHSRKYGGNKDGDDSSGSQATAEEVKQDRVAIAKTIALAALYNIKLRSQQAWVDSKEAREAAKQYFLDQYATPLLSVSKRFGKIAAGLVDQLIVKAPVTLVMLSTGGAGYVVNVAAKIVGKFNSWGRKTTTTLLSDTAANEAAALAIDGVSAKLKTATVGFIIANQLGFLPISTVAAAIIFYLQNSIGTGTGRAYVISSFYAWYLNQDSKKQEDIDNAAWQYAKAATGAVSEATLQATAELLAAKIGDGVVPKNESKTETLDKGTLTTALTQGVPAAAAAAAASAPPESPMVTGVASSAFMGPLSGPPAPSASSASSVSSSSSSAQLKEEQANAGRYGATSSSKKGTVGKPPRSTVLQGKRGRSEEEEKEEEEGVASSSSSSSTDPMDVALSPPGVVDKKPREQATSTRSSSRLKGVKGGAKKTRAKKTKRRVTRRKPRAVKFAY